MAETPSPRLGRGLASLLGDRDVRAAPGTSGALLDLALDAIRPNPRQPRRTVDVAGLEALAASIRASGVVQPVIVRALGDGGYELIAGERRWRAARLAGLERIPALAREAGERERLEVALVENIAREDLNPIDVAQACAALVEDFGQTHGQVAERLGRSRPAVSNLLRLLELPEEVQDLVAAGALSEGHARAVLMADGARRRRELARRAVDEGLSVRAVEELARRAAAEPLVARSRPEPPPVADEAMDAFYGAFGAPVRVRAATRGSVVVELRFADEAALRAALGRLRPEGPTG